MSCALAALLLRRLIGDYSQRVCNRTLGMQSDSPAAREAAYLHAADLTKEFQIREMMPDVAMVQVGRHAREWRSLDSFEDVISLSPSM